MVDRGIGDPRRSTPHQSSLDGEFTDNLARWAQEDPAPRPQHALPSSTVRLISDSFHNSLQQRNHVVADLVTVAYFFLLRVGEYTHTTARKGQTKRTVPLRKQDITFWKDKHVLPHCSTLAELLQADGVTINLANQKNGKRNTQLFHSHSNDINFTPTRSLARLVHLIRDQPDDKPLGSYRDGNGWKRASARHILEAVRLGAVQDNLAQCGFDLKRIGTHSLRSGGATRLKIEGHADSTIMLLGRWSGNTYLKYIQTQITQLSAGIAATMAPSLKFDRVGH